MQYLDPVLSVVAMQGASGLHAPEGPCTIAIVTVSNARGHVSGLGISAETPQQS